MKSSLIIHILVLGIAAQLWNSYLACQELTGKCEFTCEIIQAYISWNWILVRNHVIIHLNVIVHLDANCLIYLNHQMTKGIYLLNV